MEYSNRDREVLESSEQGSISTKLEELRVMFGPFDLWEIEGWQEEYKNRAGGNVTLSWRGNGIDLRAEVEGENQTTVGVVFGANFSDEFMKKEFPQGTFTKYDGTEDFFENAYNSAIAVQLLNQETIDYIMELLEPAEEIFEY